MSGRYNEGVKQPIPSQRLKREALPLWAWLDAAPAAWLVLVVSAYACLAFADMVPTKRPVPGIPEADRLVLPFLLLTVSAGIIRYFWLRVREWIAHRAPASPELGHRDIA